MTRREIDDYFAALPHFQPRKVKTTDEMFSLDALKNFLHRIGDPQNDLRYIHIGGTNGKGSTTAFLASVLREAGLYVASFTSPALIDNRELYRIDGEVIKEESYDAVMSYLIQEREAMEKAGEKAPSEFELYVCAAFLLFRQAGCQLVLMEVAMGGRLDATNVIPVPVLTIFTPIQYDHTEILGNTLTEIAGEKAGILKAGTYCISAPQDPEALGVIEARCKKLGIPLEVAEPVDSLTSYHMRGEYQKVNAGTAACAARLILEKLLPSEMKNYRMSSDSIPREENIEEQISSGLQMACWPGRFEIFQKKGFATVVIDGAHNPQGIEALVSSIREEFPGRKIKFLMGVLGDKAVDKMIEEILPLAFSIDLVTVPSPRALSKEDLEERILHIIAEEDRLSRKDILIHKHESIEEAVRYLWNQSSEEDVVCIFGSLYYLGIARREVIRRS